MGLVAVASVLGAAHAGGACGGGTDPAISGGLAESGAPTDGNTATQDSGVVQGTHSPGCPDKEPALNEACKGNALACEYGDDFNPACNRLLSCSGGAWSVQSAGGLPECPSNGPPKDPPPPANAAECPTSLPSGACAGTLSCRYGASLETLCACGPICSSYPVARCEDGGIDWRCGPAPKNSTICPVPRPRLGEACAKDGESCRVGPARAEACEESSIVCRSGTWQLALGGCPISSARHKEDISYLEDEQLNELSKELLSVRLATYKYRAGVADGEKHLGFIIEDQPAGSPAVLASRDRVDLYGYISMAVGALQVQSKEIASLKREVAELKAARTKP